MKTKVYGVLLFLLAASALRAENTDPLLLLKKSDDTLFDDKGKWQLRIEDYEKGQYKRYYLFECLVNGPDQLLLISKEPAIVRGQTILRLKDIITIYLKKIDKLERVSPKVAFYNSTFAQEDITSTKLSTFYDFESIKTITENGRDLNVLSLTANNKGVAYKTLINYIDAVTFQPVRREYFSYSGQKIKEMKIDKIEYDEKKKLKYLELSMYDSIKVGYYSKVIFSGFDYAAKITDNMFTVAYMKLAAN